jgi:hypothetical protein
MTSRSAQALFLLALESPGAKQLLSPLAGGRITQVGKVAQLPGILIGAAQQSQESV